jgi:hypothetical protein
MKQLFTISGRYAATEDLSITPQVGEEYKIKILLCIHFRYSHKNLFFFECFFFFFCFDCVV